MNISRIVKLKEIKFADNNNQLKQEGTKTHSTFV